MLWKDGNRHGHIRHNPAREPLGPGGSDRRAVPRKRHRKPGATCQMREVFSRLGLAAALLLVLMAAVPAAAVPDGAAAALPPAGVWPLPSSIVCTKPPGAAAGPALSASLRLVVSGPGMNAAVTTGALARYKPLLLGAGGSAFLDRQAPEGSSDIQAISIAVATAASDLSAATDYSYTLQVTAGSATITATAASLAVGETVILLTPPHHPC